MLKHALPCQNLLFPAQLPKVWPRMKAENHSVALRFGKFLAQERPRDCEAVPDIRASLESTVVYDE
jgi:hypothetical protein